MLTEIFKQLKTALILLMLFTLLTGFIYPMIVTGIAQLCFSWRASGSLIDQDGKIIGSELIGQAFTDPNYFWGRPSATMPFPYNAQSSSGSNLGPSNPNFLVTVKNRVANLRASDSQNHDLIPVDLVTASGSGLDPEISPLAAYYQAHRIAKVRGLSEDQILTLIDKAIKKRFLGIFGESRVNVLQLNLALDNLSKHSHWLTRNDNDRTTSQS